MEWVETTADTVEEAKERALDQLGVHPDDAEFELLNDVRTGLFGRVKDPARVRARVRPRTPRPKLERRRKGKRGSGSGQSRRGSRSEQSAAPGDDHPNGGPARGERSKTASSAGAEPKTASPRPDARRRSSERDDSRPRRERSRSVTSTDNTDSQPEIPLAEQADLAQEFVEGLAERFGVVVECSREYVTEREIRIAVLGDDLGRMVGRGGVTARAIDDLTRTVLQRRAGSSRNGWVRVDVGGVRARRMEFLAKFCREQAEAVRESGVARVLEPMGAADRKIVHDTIGAEDGVSSTSEGDEPRRRVVILPAASDV